MRRVILTMAVLCALTVTGAGQQPPPRFEVASIKPSAVDSRTPDNVEVQPSGRVIITNTVLEHLVRGVFEVERHEMVVGERVPSWFASERWDIIAQGPPITEVSQQQIRTMIQNLLIERFKLVTRRVTRDTPMYALVVARSDRRLGPQMKPSSADCAALLAAFKATGATFQTPDSNVCGGKSLKGRIHGIGANDAGATGPPLQSDHDE